MDVDARLVLLRHGEADAEGRCYGRREDPPLSTRGIIQARRAAERLALHGIDRVVCSPALRATSTLAHLQSAGLTDELHIVVDDRLAERDFGTWEGRLWDELWDEAPEEIRTDAAAYAMFTPPGGETSDAVTDRVAAALHAAASQGGTTLLVTHAGPIRAALALALDVALATTFRFTLEHGRAVQLAVVGEHTIVEGLGW